MLDANSSLAAHTGRNLALIVLSFALLPITTAVLAISLFLGLFTTSKATRTRRHVRSPRSPYFEPQTVLVTGVGMTKGLALARLFYAAGHNVIGADFEPPLLPIACGRMSKALKRFYRLEKTDGSTQGQMKYTQSILNIVRKEKVAIWVSCSGVASALDDGLAKEMVEALTPCKAVQYDVKTTKTLHEKHSFIDHTRGLGLNVPDTHTVTSKTAALHVLGDAAGTRKKYVMKYIGTDDAVRGDMTLLPLDTHAKTKAHISRLPITEERPWILQQYIQGPEYCTHALVIRGEVKAFVACPSKELLMHYEALPDQSSLSQSMLRFTQEFAAAGGPTFTGHLSFDFLVEDAEVEASWRDPARNVTLYPIECNPRAHTAVCLFNDSPEMIEGYMALLQPKQSRRSSKSAPLTPNGLAQQPIVPNRPEKKYYWIGHDLVELLILPVLSLFRDKGPSFVEVFESMATFAEHVIWWQDGTYEFWDPLPAWWLYHIYWPAQFAIALFSLQKWSRLNVSTCKMFMC